MKVLKISIVIIVILMVSACTFNSSKLETKDKDSETKIGNTESETQQPKEENKKIRNFMENVSSWKENRIHTTKYDLDQESCPNGTIAPSYADEKRIIFLSYGEGNDDDEIIEFLRDKNTCQVLYKFNGISDLTGKNGKVFWPEYNTNQTTGVEWKIKQLELANKKVSTIEKGGSFNNTPTPTLRTGDNSINWIEYESNGTMLKSKLISYNINSNEKSVVTIGNLDESDKREGEYFIIQKGVGEDFLIYKSIFKDGEKTFNISLYNSKGQLISSFINKDKIIDFISNEKYFVHTGEGHLTILDQDKQTTEHVYDTGDRLTTDTPIFVNEKTLIFRYAMNNIFISNIENDTVFSILENTGEMVSKPIFTNGNLVYAIASREKEEMRTEFYVVKISEK